MPKKRKTKNPTKSQRELAASYQTMLDKWANVPCFGRGPRPSGTEAKTIAKYVPSSRPAEGSHLKADMDSLRGSTALKQTTKYTGTKMLGVGGLHKSNQVPVFSEAEARDLATMRRG